MCIDVVMSDLVHDMVTIQWSMFNAYSIWKYFMNYE